VTEAKRHSPEEKEGTLPLDRDVSEALRRMARSSLGPLGRYEILEEIGQGGMGKVFKAQQTNPRRVVALKILRSSIPTNSEVLRFEREFQILGQLHHPGIAQVFDAGTENVGLGEQPFFAMELVEGPPLPEYLAGAKLGMKARLHLFLEICDAVGHAHDQGIIHRDLTPKNILVDPSGHPKIIDFGVARACGANIGVDALTTRTGQVLGTPQYMSPEQARGNGDNIGVRSDIYALGLILHEVLTGAPPYDISTETSTEATRIICEEPPPRPSLQRSELRGDLDAIILKALEKEPEHRYASADEFVRDLNRFLAHEPILARAPGSWRRLTKWVQRHPTRGLAAGMVGLALIGFSIFGVAVAVNIWSTAQVARAAWDEGDLEGTRHSLKGIPPRADSLLLPDPLSAISEQVRDLSGDLPTVQVIADLEAHGPKSAWLLAARFLERDGLEAHPVLADSLVRALRTPPGDRDPTRLDAIRIVGRLFFDRPIGDPRELERGTRLREGLHELAGEELSHPERLHLFTALSGCGTTESFEVLLPLLDTSRGLESRTERAEEVRLGIRAVEMIVLRAHRCGYLDDLTEEMSDRVLSHSHALIEGFGAAPLPIAVPKVLGELCCSMAIARRAAGILPSDLLPPLTARNARRLLAARGDPELELVDELTGSPADSLDALGASTSLEIALRCYVILLGLASPPGDLIHVPEWAEAEEQALRAAVDRGLSQAEAEEVLRNARDTVRNLRSGLRPDFVPDEDTHLGAFFEQLGGPIEPCLDTISLDDEEGVIARWDFSEGRPAIVGKDASVFWRGLIVSAAESNPLDGYVRLGAPGISLLGFHFEGPPSSRHYVAIRISAVKALRRLLPYSGECYVSLRIDGELLGKYRLETTNNAFFELTTLWNRFGSGPHTLTLEPTFDTNTTVRIRMVEMIVVPD
jgi:predicted Ser/Thr protein kinase